MHFVSYQVHCVYYKKLASSSSGALTWVHALRAAAIAAKLNYTDMDIISFLTNVECRRACLRLWPRAHPEPVPQACRSPSARARPTRLS